MRNGAGRQAVAMRIRQAQAEDAAAMDAVLSPILERWGSDRPRGPAHVLSHYVAHPARLSCCIAEEGGRILGFQSLKRAEAGNPYDLPEGWGIIGTYVAAEASGRGVARALFNATRAMAEAAGLSRIDATIGAANAEGLAYYEALGFRTWRKTGSAVGKVCDVAPLRR
jgi:GNAT superfamily N-acetyltransferase